MNEYYAEPDHEPDEEIEDPEIDDHMDPGVRIKPRQPDEDDDWNAPKPPSFYDRYGFDERDGPSEEKERGDDPPHLRW